MITVVPDGSVAAGDAPVTYAEAKAFLNLADDTEQTLVESIILAATIMAEEITNRSIRTQTFLLYSDLPPAGGRADVALPFPPLVSVTHVKYKDANGTLQTLSSSEYAVDIDSTPGRIVLVPASTGWPDTQSEGIQTFQVKYAAGYASAAATPAPIKHAIKMLVAHFYEHRMDVVETGGMGGALQKAPQAAHWLLFPYKVWKF